MAKKISNGLLTLSSAAILAVYAAGYERTNPAAERFAAQLALPSAVVGEMNPSTGAGCGKSCCGATTRYAVDCFRR